jgi:hypothetical protein
MRSRIAQRTSEIGDVVEIETRTNTTKHNELESTWGWELLMFDKAGCIPRDTCRHTMEWNSASNVVTHETCCSTSQGGTSYGRSSSNRTQHRLRKKVKKKKDCCSLASLISCPRLTRSSGSFKISFHDLRAARTYYFTEKTKLCAAVGSSICTIFFCKGYT